MKKIKEEIEMLEYLSQQVVMEKDTYSFLIRKISESKIEDFNMNLLHEIKQIIIEYNKFINSIIKMLKNRNKEIKKEDLFFRMATYFSIDISKSTQLEIVKHLIHGTEVVKNKTLERLNESSQYGKTIKNLYDRFFSFEENIINSMEKYLIFENQVLKKC